MNSDTKETRNSILHYKNNIITVRLKEKAEINVESMKEQYEAQQNLVGNNRYVVLVDATKNSDADSETRKFMADYKPVNRIATAIVSNTNIATMIMANAYMRLNQPSVTTKLFKQETQALKWLREKLDATL